MRQVRPTILPLRLRIALIRWSVRSMPARLSSPREPMWSTTWAMSASVISRSSSVTSASGKRASGRRPRSRTTSIRSCLSGRAWAAAPISGGSDARSTARSSIDSRRSSEVNSATPLADAGRHEGRLGDADERFLHQQRDGRDGAEAGLLQPAVDGRLVCAHRRDDAMVMTMIAVALRSRRDHTQSVTDEWRGVSVRADDDLQIVGLVLLRDTHLEEAVELGPVLAAAVGVLDEGLDVGEAEDRSEAR